MQAELASVLPPVLDETDAEAERFFAEGEASGEGSLAPSTLDEELWEAPRPVPLEPAVLERRARFRRWVAIGLTSGVSALVVLIAATRFAGHSRSSPRTHAAHAQAAKRLVEVTSPSAGVVATPPSAGVAATPPSAGVAATPPSATSVPVTSSPPRLPVAPSAAPSPSSATPAPVDDATVSGRELTRKARSLLRSGHTREGIAVARAAIEADATLPAPYVLLAAGLEDLGKWGEAQETFALCSARTQSSECRYFAGGRR